MEPLVHYKEEILSYFQCQSTGNCCRTPGYVYASHAEIIKMAQILDISIETFRAHFVQTINGRNLIATPQFRHNCFLNDNNECTVYDGRPHHCQTYPNWPYIWKNDQELLNESEQCKGLKLAIERFKTATSP